MALASSWRQAGGRIGGTKEAGTTFDPHVAGEQGRAIASQRTEDLRQINAGILAPEHEAALIFDMLRGQRLSGALGGNPGFFPGEQLIDVLPNGAAIYAADEHFRGRTGESTQEILDRISRGDIQDTDLALAALGTGIAVEAALTSPLLLVGAVASGFAPFVRDSLVSKAKGISIAEAEQRSLTETAPQLVKIVNGITALAIATSGIGVGGGTVKKLAEGGDHSKLDGPHIPKWLLGATATLAAFLAACERTLTAQPTIQVIKETFTPKPPSESTPTPKLSPKPSETPQIISATIAVVPSTTESPAVTPTPSETPIPYGIDAWQPASGGEGGQFTPLLVPDRTLLDAHPENANYQLLIATINRGQGEERVTGFRDRTPDGFEYSSLPGIDVPGDSDIVGPDGHAYHLNPDQSHDGVIRYSLTGQPDSGQQEMEMIFVNLFHTGADGMAIRQSDRVLVPVTVAQDGRITEVQGEPNHFFFVIKGSQVVVDLDGQDGNGRFVAVHAPDGGGTIWLDLPPAPPPVATPTFRAPDTQVAPTATFASPEASPVSEGGWPTNCRINADMRSNCSGTTEAWKVSGLGTPNEHWEQENWKASGWAADLKNGQWIANGIVTANSGGQVTIRFDGSETKLDPGSGLGTVSGTRTFDIGPIVAIYYTIHNLDTQPNPVGWAADANAVRPNDLVVIWATPDQLVNGGGTINFVVKQ